MQKHFTGMKSHTLSISLNGKTIDIYYDNSCYNSRHAYP